jgi:hypothetical protein
VKERNLIAFMGLGLGVGVFVACVLISENWTVSAIFGIVAWMAVCGISRTVD